MTETLRDGRYALARPLGSGAQGQTFDGVDRKEGRPVAIKRFSVRGAKSWKDVELAEREARVLAQLHHPKLPAYLDHFEEDGALYLVMEKIEGESLAALRQRGAVLGEDDVVRLLCDASEVLEYLHGRAPPVIHRDLKPGNVIRRPDGSFAFVDFGAVRDKLRPEGGSTVVGTFGYMAPEQFQGRALPASDVYGVGVTALTVLTGLQPEDLPHKGLGIDVAEALRGRARPELAEALGKMLEIDPDRRPASIAPLLSGLGRPARGGGRRERGRHAGERARARGERRMARRSGRSWSPGWPVLLLLTLALTAASVAIALALRVFVPVLLTLLSLFFGRSLREAAGRVSEAGKRAEAALGRARRATQRGLEPDEEPAPEIRVRVKDDQPSRVRVEDERDAEEAAEEAGSDRDETRPPRSRA